MQRLVCRVACFLFLLSALQVSQVVLPDAGANASQPWWCICSGKKKRYIASTRHCELLLGIPKGKWCSKAQFRRVYGSACRDQGCRLAN